MVRPPIWRDEKGIHFQLDDLAIILFGTYNGYADATGLPPVSLEEIIGGGAIVKGTMAMIATQISPKLGEFVAEYYMGVKGKNKKEIGDAAIITLGTSYGAILAGLSYGLGYATGTAIEYLSK